MTQNRYAKPTNLRTTQTGKKPQIKEDKISKILGSFLADQLKLFDFPSSRKSSHNPM